MNLSQPFLNTREPLKKLVCSSQFWAADSEPLLSFPKFDLFLPKNQFQNLIWGPHAAGYSEMVCLVKLAQPFLNMSEPLLIGINLGECGGTDYEPRIIFDKF